MSHFCRVSVSGAAIELRCYGVFSKHSGVVANVFRMPFKKRWSLGDRSVNVATDGARNHASVTGRHERRSRIFHAHRASASQ